MNLNSKWVFLNPTFIQFGLMKDLMQKRLEENSGETIYEIGIGEKDEDGLGRIEYAKSVESLKLLATMLNSDCIVIEENCLQTGMTGKFWIRKKTGLVDLVEDMVRAVENEGVGLSPVIKSKICNENSVSFDLKNKRIVNEVEGAIAKKGRFEEQLYQSTGQARQNNECCDEKHFHSEQQYHFSSLHESNLNIEGDSLEQNVLHHPENTPHYYYLDQDEIVNRSGGVTSVEKWINTVTPVKNQNARDFYEHFSTSEVEAEDEPQDASPEATLISPETTSTEEAVDEPAMIQMVQMPPPAQQMFVCPVVGCSNKIKFARNIQRHIDTKHGVEQDDGSFAITKYVCKYKNCRAKNLYFSNFVVHFRSFHPTEYAKHIGDTIPKRFWIEEKTFVEKFEYK